MKTALLISVLMRVTIFILSVELSTNTVLASSSISVYFTDEEEHLITSYDLNLGCY